ncbi:hypothetical protein AB833_04325 [Chromatiales bacterium (ex Bugula neritina AB1)]|nr:hypothetical protein AB833_04325 [Chromatiales bacterium (ex Bugula neritina AB1)]
MNSKLFLNQIGDSVLLAENARRLSEGLAGELPDTEELLRLTENYGIDLATSVLHQSILRHERHGDFCARLERTAAVSDVVEQPPRLFIVPGLYYNDFPEIGAHGDLLRQVAARFGVDAQRIPTNSRGSIGQNVEILHAALLRHADQPFWLASVSRGSAEIKWLMHHYPGAEYLENLKGWVSINGVVRGTGLLHGAGKSTVKRRLLQALAMAKSVSPLLIDELNPQRPEWNYAVSEKLFYLNVVSVPMSWDITYHVQKRYRQLSSFGPNDGVATLGDYTKETGLLYPLSGVDHLLRTNRLASVFYQLLRLLFLPAVVQEKQSNREIKNDQGMQGNNGIRAGD